MPEIAKLAIIIDALAARRDVRALHADLTALGNAANTGAQGSQRALNNLSNTAQSAAKNVEKSAKDAANGFKSMEDAIGRVGKAVIAYVSVAKLAEFTKGAVETSLAYDRIRLVLEATRGSAELAAQDFQFLQQQAERIGISFTQSAQAFAKFSSAATLAGLSQRQVKDTFVAVAEAARRFGLTAESQSRVFLALEQLTSKGVVSMEELRRQLGDALPGAFQIGARAMNMTSREFNKLVESGQLMTTDFLPAFTRELAKVAPAGEAMASTAAELNRLKTAWDNFRASVGQSLPVQTFARAAINILTSLTPRQNPERDQEIREIAEGLGYDFSLRRGVFLSRAQGEKDRKLQEAALAEMERRETIRANVSAGVEGLRGAFNQQGEDLRSFFGQFTASPTAEQEKKFNRLSRGLSDDGLEGRDALIQSYKNQSEAVKKLGLTFRQEAEALDLVAEAKSRALEKYDAAQLLKSEVESAKELTNAYLKTQEAVERFNNEAIGDDTLRKIDSINKAYRESVYELLQYDEAGMDVAEALSALNAARDAQIQRAGQSNVRPDGYRGPPDFREVAESWGDLEDRIAVGSADIADSLDRNFTDAFSSMIMGTKSVGDAFKEMATSIVNDLVRIMVQQLIVRSVLQGFGGLSGRGGGDAGVDHAGFGSFNHYGGVIGGYGESRRKHDGGVMGDEVNVIGRRGEVMFTPEQMDVLGKAISRGGGSGREQKVEVINVMDPALLTEAIYKNKNAIINIIGRESKTVRRTLG